MPGKSASCCLSKSCQASSSPTSDCSSTSGLTLPALHQEGKSDPITPLELSMAPPNCQQDKQLSRSLGPGPSPVLSLTSDSKPPYLALHSPLPLHLRQHAQKCFPLSVPPVRYDFKCHLLPAAFLPCQGNDFPLSIPSTQQGFYHLGDG